MEIGGFVREAGWDVIDGHLCRRKGWIALSEDGPDLRLVHLRRMGSSQAGLWAGRQRWGRGKYVAGSAWYYVAASSVSRAFEPPWVVGGAGIALGYAKAALTRVPRFGDEGYRSCVRRYELLSLAVGKRRALRLYSWKIRRGAWR